MALSAIRCQYVTEDCIREWKSTNSARKLAISVTPSRFVFELCQTVVRGELPITKCRVALDAVHLAEPLTKEETSSLLVDTIAHLGQELTVPGEFRSRLTELAKWLVDSGLVPVRLLQERCEAEFLWEAEMIKIKAPDMKSKEVRVNTRLLYQQTKFNLLREESEGYAKLLTLLSQRGPDGLTPQRATAVISTIKSLIGQFDLDPNRVFDIVLECFELQPENTTFLELIPLFPKSHTTHILGFKFQFYQRSEVEDPVPTGLYRLAATLIKANYIDLDSIYTHLSPTDQDALEQYEEITNKRMDEANKIGKINLAAIGKDLMDDEKPGDVTIDLYAALDMENEAVAERSNELLTNQKLGLLVGSLSVGDWPHAHILFERLAPLHPVAHEQICYGLCRAIENAILPYYAYVRPEYLSRLGSRVGGDIEVKLAGPPELPKNVFQMLSRIGPYLHRNVLLLQKVCRVLRGYYEATLAHSTLVSNAQDDGEIEKRDVRQAEKEKAEAASQLEEALGACLLPSLQLLPANPAVGLAIWEVMTLLPYELQYRFLAGDCVVLYERLCREVLKDFGFGLSGEQARYRLYGEWDKEDEQIPMVLAARQTARLDTRRILKRLAKENLKQLGRMVAKIAHANPMTVLRTIVHQIEAYKDMIAPVVDAFKYLTQLEYDVLEYVVIERLSQSGRDKLKDDGLNVSDWLQSLASFWGHLCKKYPSMELRGLFQYLVNQLKKGEGIELVLLQELMQQMAGVEYTENVTEDQLEAMAGGEAIRYQATAFGLTKNNKTLIKSTNRLRDSLLGKDEPKLAVPLLLLIAQQRSHVVVHANAPYIKMVSEQFDRCHGQLLQYVEFLTSAVSPVLAYAQLIPSLDDLIHKYHLEPEVAFLIYRPVIRLFKPYKGSNVAWPADTSKALSQSSSKEENGPSKTASELVLDLGPHRKIVKWSELLDIVRSILPAKAWTNLSPEFYTAFWGLTLQDLYVPRKRYEVEISKQRAALKALEESSDNSHLAIAKRKKDKEKIQEVLDRLSAELQKQEATVTSINQRLVREKDGWLASCSESLKINMEFLQRCIFPRCVMSMMDAVYCARFVHTIHSLGTPFFNTINHIDALICKTLFPMICCCTEYEAGRLGRFLCETLKMAYHWKSDEEIYEKECGNMPGFSVFYRDPNSARVNFGQYIRVHWKWNSRLTRLLIQCLESEEYMEIRNALTVLTKIATIFPVLKKSGITLERRVVKIKGDDREDLKVLATGVAATLASRKSMWLTDDEFTLGLLEIKPAPAKAGGIPASAAAPSSTAAVEPSSNAGSGTTGVPTSSETVTTVADSKSVPSEPQAKGTVLSVKVAPVRNTVSSAKTSGSHEVKASVAPSRGSVPASRVAVEAPSHGGPPAQGAVGNIKLEDGSTKPLKTSNVESEGGRPHVRRANSTSVPQVLTSSVARDDAGPGRSGAATSPPKAERESRSESGPALRQRNSTVVAAAGVTSNGTAVGNQTGPVKASMLSSARAGTERLPHDNPPRMRSSVEAKIETSVKVEAIAAKVSEGKVNGERGRTRLDVNDTPASKSPSRQEDVHTLARPVDDTSNKERSVKRSVLPDDADRLNKRRKGDNAGDKSIEAGEVRPSERERGSERDTGNHDERVFERPRERSLERARDRAGDRGADRVEREHRVTERDRVDEHAGDRFRDRSSEQLGKERSVDRSSDRVADRVRTRYSDLPAEQPHPDDRFPMQNQPHSLPPPPPIPPNVVPRTVTASRVGEEESVEAGRVLRNVQRLSPRWDDKAEKRRNDDGVAVGVALERRRENESRDRKRIDDRDQAIKVDKEREREKEKEKAIKEEDLAAASAASKRRRIKRDHLAGADLPPDFGLAPPPLLPGPAALYEGRDRDRKGGSGPTRSVVTIEDVGAYDSKGTSSGRIHAKENTKVARREQHEQTHEREWEDEKRQRGDLKPRRHHRK